MIERDMIEAMASARKVMSDAAFRHAGGMINDERNATRERMQMQTAPEIAAIIKKLRAEQDVTPEDLALIRLWVIGDAESYLRAEADFARWLEEHARLTDVLAGFAGRDCSVAELLEVQGVLEDAARVSLDIANYLEKKERVANFEATMADPARINKPVLASVLSRKLESDLS